MHNWKDDIIAGNSILFSKIKLPLPCLSLQFYPSLLGFQLARKPYSREARRGVILTHCFWKASVHTRGSNVSCILVNSFNAYGNMCWVFWVAIDFQDSGFCEGGSISYFQIMNGTSLMSQMSCKCFHISWVMTHDARRRHHEEGRKKIRTHQIKSLPLYHRSVKGTSHWFFFWKFKERVVNLREAC